MALNPTLSLAGQMTVDKFNLSEPRSLICKWGFPKTLGTSDVELADSPGRMEDTTVIRTRLL